MNKKLIYLYINDINRGFHNIDFNFTDDFKVKYNPQNHELDIEKKELKNYRLWGSRINSIDLIVGKNGAGKSTILDLIAETNINRRNLFNKYSDGIQGFDNNKFCEWFAIYHLEKNLFVVEGASPNLLFEKNITTSHEYSLVCKYDFMKKKLLFKEYIQSYKRKYKGENNKRSIRGGLCFIYFRNSKGLPWFKDERLYYSLDHIYEFDRFIASKAHFSNIYHFICSEYDVLESEKFTAQNIFCTIDIKNFSYEDIESVGLKFMGEKPLITSLFLDDYSIKDWDEDNSYYSNFSTKQKLIIALLEHYIMCTWKIEIESKNLNTEKITKWKKLIESVELKDFTKSDIFKYKLNYLLKVISQLCEIISEEIPGDNKTNYASDILHFIISLSDLNEEYFVSYDQIKIPISNQLDLCVEKLLKVYDSYSKLDMQVQNDLKSIISIQYENMSKGEMIFVNHFSSLYKSINDAEKNNVKNIILCLDEPEESFHPEWARKYIYYLTIFLNKIHKSNIKYQVIISTHSPFIVSDIPSNNITCIKLFEEEGEYSRITQKANFGFGSNLYDIIKNDFFLGSSIGEFATNEINKILNKINKLTVYDEKKVTKLESLINIIDDKFIQNKLMAILKNKVGKIMSEDKKIARIRELEEELSRLKEN